MAERRNMVIHFTDGSKVSFDFPQQVKDPNMMIGHIEKVLNSPYITIEAEGVVHLYPRENIKSIQVYPASPKLPDFVIKGATSADLY